MISINCDTTRITPFCMKPNCSLQSRINSDTEERERGREGRSKRAGCNKGMREVESSAAGPGGGNTCGEPEPLTRPAHTAAHLASSGHCWISCGGVNNVQEGMEVPKQHAHGPPSPVTCQSYYPYRLQRSINGSGRIHTSGDDLGVGRAMGWQCVKV